MVRPEGVESFSRFGYAFAPGITPNEQKRSSGTPAFGRAVIASRWLLSARLKSGASGLGWAMD
jgi:hypothetical protein